MKNILPLICSMFMWIFFSNFYVNFDNVLQIKVGKRCITIDTNKRGVECFKTQEDCQDRFNEIWKLIIADSRNPDLYLTVPKYKVTPFPTSEPIDGEEKYEWQ